MHRAGDDALERGSPSADVVEVRLPARGRGGRPRSIEGPAATLSVWLPASAYDRLATLAQRRRQSVSAYVREVLIILTGAQGR